MKPFDTIIDWGARMPVWLQWSWGAWLGAGFVLLILSLPYRERQEPERETQTEQIPSAPRPKPDTIVIRVGPDTITAVTHTEIGTDSSGKRASFAIDLIANEMHWALNRDDTVLLNKKPFDIPEFFRFEGLQARFDSAVDLIAIGSASEEGDDLEEYDLARRRANQLKVWLRETVKNPHVQFRYLILGKFHGASQLSTDETAYQRSIVVVRVRQKEPGINLSEALHEALSKMSDLPFPLEKYPAFDLVPKD